MDNRSDWVDYAKAIGIILVVYGHVARGLYNAGVGIPKGFFELADGIIYSFHMPLFFFLSGIFFLHSLTKRGGQKIVFSKIDTIVYPYIVWSIIQGLIEAYLSAYTNGNVAYADVFSLLWSPRAQFWFLYILFICFIVATIIFSVIPKKATLIVLVGASLAYIYSSSMPSGFVYLYMSENFVFFIFGIVFSIYNKKTFFSSPASLLLLAVLFVIGQYLFHHTFHIKYFERGLASLLLAIVSILFIVALSSWAALRPNRLLAMIGASSMAIYLMHILAGSGIRVILKTFLGIDSYIVHLVLGCFFGLVLPLLAVFILNKLKIPYVFSAPVSEKLLLLFKKRT